MCWSGGAWPIPEDIKVRIFAILELKARFGCEHLLSGSEMSFSRLEKIISNLEMLFSGQRRPFSTWR
jgi:hypothetical protein